MKSGSSARAAALYASSSAKRRRKRWTTAKSKIKRVVKPNVFGTAGKAGPLQCGTEFLTAPLAVSGDDWLSDDSVFEPWKGEAGGFETVSYYARAGHATLAAKRDFELVPTAASRSTLTVLYRNKPLPKVEVTVIDPQKWQKTPTSDAKGQVTLPKLRAGRHILVATNKEPVSREIAGKQVSMVQHISTLTFLAKQAWSILLPRNHRPGVAVAKSRQERTVSGASGVTRARRLRVLTTPAWQLRAAACRLLQLIRARRGLDVQRIVLAAALVQAPLARGACAHAGGDLRRPCARQRHQSVAGAGIADATQ